MSEAHFNAEQLAALERARMVLAEQFESDVAYASFLINRFEEYEYGQVVLDNMNSSNFDDWISFSRDDESSLEVFADYLATTTGLATAISQDAAAFLKPASPSEYFLKWD